MVLQHNDGWDQQRLERELASGHTRTVKLDRQIPVLLMYFTAEALNESEILFRNDLYRRDNKIIDALDRPLSHNASIDMAAWYP